MTMLREFLLRPIRLPRVSLLDLATAIVAALALWYQVNLLDHMEWGDESETIVTAKMLAAGMRLYSEVFNHHGPLTFLPGYVLELFGSFGVAAHRVVIVLLQWLAMLAIYLSPVLRDAPARKAVIALALAAMLHLLPLDTLYGHTYIYQVIGGLLVMIIVAQYTLPALAHEPGPSRAGVALGSLLIVSLPFLAVSYLPAAGLLFLCSLTRASWKRAVGWSLAGVLANLAFLGLTGSYKGYLAYHIYLNASILPQYNGGQDAAQLVRSAFEIMTGGATSATVNPCFPMWLVCAGLVWLERRWFAWRSALVILALLSFGMRGLEFRGATFWYALLGVGTLLLARPRRLGELRGVLLCAVAAGAYLLAYPLLFDMAYFIANKRTETTRFGELAKALTGKNDRIIAYSFRNFDYIAADRLPASGHFFYLPWQAKYNEAPRFGIHVDACADIRKNRPKLVYLDAWTVWDRYPWLSYGACIQQAVDQDYTRLPGHSVYVRNDYYAQAVLLVADWPR